MGKTFDKVEVDKATALVVINFLEEHKTWLYEISNVAKEQSFFAEADATEDELDDTQGAINSLLKRFDLSNVSNQNIAKNNKS